MKKMLSCSKSLFNRQCETNSETNCEADREAITQAISKAIISANQQTNFDVSASYYFLAKQNKNNDFLLVI
jgi:hypothetical protein